MATPKRLEAYPFDFFELFRKALDTGSVEVKLPSKRDAESLRLKLYGFRKALVEQTEQEEELALLADSLLFKIKDNILLIETHDTDPTVRAVRDAIQR